MPQANSPWTPLRDGVGWSSPPLFSVSLSRAHLTKTYGPPHARSLDSNGVGLFDAWFLRFPCGLECAIWIFHTLPDGTKPANDHVLSNVEVHANQRDRLHLAFHLRFQNEQIKTWIPDQTIIGSLAWNVWRQDDNGNKFKLASFSSECEASALAKHYEDAGHKQHYWIECAPP